MAYAMQGLRLKPTYEQLIGVAVSDGLENVKFPNRNATFFKKWVHTVTIRWGGGQNYGRPAKKTH